MTTAAARAEAGILSAVERRTGLTPAGLSAFGLAAGAWLAGYAFGVRVLSLMAYGTAALLGVLGLAGRRRLPVSAVRSSIPARMREGQSVFVEIEVSARRRTGALELVETLDRLRVPVRLLVGTVPAGTPVRHRYMVTPRLRGVYAIGPLTAIWSDPFGLTRRRTMLVKPDQVLVHPSTEAVHDRVLAREWEDPPVRPPVSKPWPTGFDFYGMRDYVPGDDPRRIVWRAVARTGQYLVREAEQGITDRAIIVLDTNEKAHSPGEPSDSFETAVRAVASLGRLHLSDGFVVAVESPEGPVTVPLRGKAALLPMLDAMARLQMGRAGLAGGIGRLVSSRRRDTHYIIVTPHLDHEAAAALRLLLAAGSSATFVHIAGEDPDPGSLERAAMLGCEVVELAPGAPLETVFRRATGAGIRR